MELPGSGNSDAQNEYSEDFDAQNGESRVAGRAGSRRRWSALADSGSVQLTDEHLLGGLIGWAGTIV